MESYRPRVVFHFLALSILLCVFFGCSDVPRVRLVKDDGFTFHFQWAEPLKEQRIILVGLNGGLENPVLEIPSRYEEILLVYFAAGTVVSAPVSRDGFWYLKRIDSVEILPAHLREKRLPAYVSEIHADGRVWQREEDDLLLREHPFFRDYRVDDPSRITFRHRY